MEAPDDGSDDGSDDDDSFFDVSGSERGDTDSDDGEDPVMMLDLNNLQPDAWDADDNAGDAGMVQGPAEGEGDQVFEKSMPPQRRRSQRLTRLSR